MSDELYEAIKTVRRELVHRHYNLARQCAEDDPCEGVRFMKAKLFELIEAFDLEFPIDPEEASHE